MSIEDSENENRDVNLEEGYVVTREGINNVVRVDIVEEMKSSYLDYSMSVIVGRALPDIRDGLKPVHRRTLYAMSKYGQVFKKSARIVGDTIGQYHPHGEAAVYDAMVRMAQDFSLRLPLVDGQGNFGSIDGDAPAATRYTEAKLSKAAEMLIDDLDKDTVDFEPNYDGTEIQPTVLPARFLNLLINGSSGIAVGMATNIPPHNVSEVCDACIAYINNPDIEIEELLTYIVGPDFPTGGVILGANSIKQAYLTGKGIITLRGEIEVEEFDKGRQALIITEIPYGVNKSKLVEKISQLCGDKTIEGITDIRDESNKNGIRVVLELKKDAYTDVIINQLFSFTVLQSSFGINMVALDNKIPRVLNLKQIISIFIEFRKEVILRRTQFLLQRDKKRAHVLLGIAIAVNNIDQVISLVRGSSNSAEAKDKLLNRSWRTSEDISRYVEVIDLEESNTSYQFSENQLKAILDMKLSRLTALEINKVLKEIDDLTVQIEYLSTILNSNQVLLELMKKEIEETKIYSTARLTKVEEFGSIDDPENLVPKEDMIVTVTINGYIKRLPLDIYKTQHRGGKGKSGLSMNPEDSIIKIFNASTHALVLFFSDLGYAYSLKLYKLPLGSVYSKGKSIVNLLNLREGEKITNIMCLPEDIEDIKDFNIVFVTKMGRIRRNNITDFLNIRTSGKIAIKLDEDDGLMTVITCRAYDHIFLATKLGKAIRFPVSKIRIMKSRTSDGVNAIKLGKGDLIVATCVLDMPYVSTEENITHESDDHEVEFNEFESNESNEAEKSESNESEKSESNEAEKEEDLEIALSDDNIENAPEAIGGKESQCILSITSRGYGKKSLSDKYRTTNRGGVGVTNININKRIGNLITALTVKQDDEVLLITSIGKILRFKVSDVRNTSRNTSGVIIAKLEEKETIVSATAIIKDDAEVLDLETSTIKI